eukprot:TRINITY_DN6114_c0_g1_i1.p1 TRINITY_DN6114_c0_g1~~TRINITY_DN6114_c0_g1_i1.p1  ORF type:complete len:521 (+),score=114.63 TRINITY_DN6114_c0_g1_i1:97-1563(+)
MSGLAAPVGCHLDAPPSAMRRTQKLVVAAAAVVAAGAACARQPCGGASSASDAAAAFALQPPSRTAELDLAGSAGRVAPISAAPQEPWQSFPSSCGAVACGLLAVGALQSASSQRKRISSGKFRLVAANRGCDGSVARYAAPPPVQTEAKTDTDTESESPTPTVKPTKKSVDAGPVPADLDWSLVSDEWEIDCFSRPVNKDGKKMWELLLTDANAVYRRVAQMKPTRVNSVVVQKIISIFIEESKVKPKTIRYFRKVMKNMLNVALNSIKDEQDMKTLAILPSRNCHMLRRWIQYRERVVYPNMEGYVKPPPSRSTPVQASMVQMAYEPLPGKLKFPRYAFSAIPWSSLQAVKPGSLPGQMCKPPSNLGDDTLVHGVILLTVRAEVICSQLRSMEFAGCRMNLETNELLMDLDIDTTYKVARVPMEDKESCLEFESQKRKLGGLHFVAIHNPLTAGEMILPGQEGESNEGGSIAGLWLCIDYSPEDSK